MGRSVDRWISAWGDLWVGDFIGIDVCLGGSVGGYSCKSIL